jgi:hypothetical protein
MLSQFGNSFQKIGRIGCLSLGFEQILIFILGRSFQEKPHDHHPAQKEKNKTQSALHPASLLSMAVIPIRMSAQYRMTTSEDIHRKLKDTGRN